MSKNFRYSLLIIIALVITTANLDWKIPDFNESDALNDHTVLVYFHDVKSLKFDSKGTLNSTLTSPSIKQFDESKQLSIHQPRLNIPRPDSNWSISANSAVMDEKGSVIELQDNVLIEQAGNTRITTDQLLIDNSKKLAETSSVVHIKNLQGNTQAKGFIANFDQQTVILKERVKTTYVPKAKP